MFSSALCSGQVQNIISRETPTKDALHNGDGDSCDVSERNALLKVTKFIKLFFRLTTFYRFQRESYVRNILYEQGKIMFFDCCLRNWLRSCYD